MSEFAFTGVGMNPHYGTPANPHDRTRRLIPGGSSSGAPVSVTDGMAVAAIGTDTGGSVRIPAALCGVVGFKPTQSRISLQGVFPLSGSLDSVGVIAPTVACCSEVDAILSGEPWVQTNIDLKSRTVAVPKNHFLEDLDPQVAAAFERSIGKLSAAGATIVEVTLPGISEIEEINGRGGLSGPEAYAWHRRLGTGFEGYDPFVRERILRGRDISAADYLDMLAVRRAIIASFNEWQAKSRWDVIACPTVPIVAPEISRLENDPKLYRHINRLLLRNPSVVNFLDRCALSLPCHAKGEAPVGLMLIGRGQEDHALLNLGIAIERALSQDN
jgi:aspartyl-tRNA(Asn)/glutamyl-tRNA(Gln) amidotransferase subunit A